MSHFREVVCKFRVFQNLSNKSVVIRVKFSPRGVLKPDILYKSKCNGESFRIQEISSLFVLVLPIDRDGRIVFLK